MLGLSRLINRGDNMLSQDERYQQFVNDFTTTLYYLNSKDPFSDYIFLCVGSDKIIGDAYGPLVGEKLKELFKNTYQNIKVVGTLEEPVSAIRLNEIIKEIYDTHRNPCIIAIDSALSGKEEVGSIFVSNTKMQCGKGIHKSAILVGDISIKAVVAKDYKISKYNFNALQNTSLGPILKLAELTSSGIYNVIKYH